MDVKKQINENGHRMTKQREIILDYLKSVTSHPTAEIIHQEVLKDMPNISLGTVYRNLKYLVDEGFVLCIIDNGGINHFDGDISEHGHFFCRKCGKIKDVVFEKTHMHKKQLDVGIVDSVDHHFYGVCTNCQKEEK
jgi:Fur family transcriptional regulator, peroxide stress response regulator